jgi:hypothetical protein
MPDRVLIAPNDLYAFIKDHSLHRNVDSFKVMETLKKKFSNDPLELSDILLDAIESEKPSKIEEMDRKYGYCGTISNIYKIVK